MDFLFDNLIAHRGFHNLEKNIPENSIKAFKEAIKNNYIIELDLHRTKDNKLVVFHDYNLKRVCGINKEIESCTYKELSKLYLFNTSSKIPLFSEVLKLVNDQVPLLIELKGKDKYGFLEKLVVKELLNYKGRYAIQSFNPFHILWFKKNRPDIIRGILKMSVRARKETTLLYNLFSSCFFLKPDFYSLDKHLINKKKKNKKVIIWTIRKKKEYDYYKKISDNLICENMYLYKEI